MVAPSGKVPPPGPWPQSLEGRRSAMAMFIVLGKLTDEGARNVGAARTMVEENLAQGERAGIKFHGWYLTQGRYDFVIIVEAPDAETMLAQAAGVASAGMSRSETLRAWTLDEAGEILARMGPAQK
jgi:uncharacterized protein with GYD domain